MGVCDHGQEHAGDDPHPDPLPQAGEGEERDTVATAQRSAARLLAAAGIEGPRREARLLAATALGCDATTILTHPERQLTPAESIHLAALVGRRAAREPAARLIGRREFWSLDFALSPETLVPRPDSETVVEAVLDALPDRAAPLRVLDLGTGTGCLLLALLSELPMASGVGVDIAPQAAATARRNAISLGLAERARFVAGSWGDAIFAGFDVIVVNPPYIATSTIAGLAPEVARHGPLRALDGGADGLMAYRALAPDIVRLLRPSGVAAAEVGAGQAVAVAAIMERAGLVACGTRRDLAGIERCVLLRGAA